MTELVLPHDLEKLLQGCYKPEKSMCPRNGLRAIIEKKNQL